MTNLSSSDLCLLAVCVAVQRGDAESLSDEALSTIVAELLERAGGDDSGWSWQRGTHGWYLGEVEQYTNSIRGNSWATEDSPLRLTPEGRRACAALLNRMLRVPAKGEALQDLAMKASFDIAAFVANVSPETAGSGA